MKRSFQISATLPFYLFAAGVYLLIVYQDLLSNGMFLDGLIYSTVSKNLANGIGTFWDPHFTSTCLQEFHEHPPLAFGFQSIFYTLFGENRLIDRFYSLFTFLVTGLIILRIWKQIGYKHGWLPLFIWLLTPTVFWSSYNNLLENTLTVFTSFSILFYLKDQDSKNHWFLFLSGFMLALGFLTKGFVAFFPWTFPILMWLIVKQKSFGNAVIETTALIFTTLAPLLLLILFFPQARLSLHTYIDNQVLNSLRNVVTVDSRFDIVKRMFSELAPGVILCFLVLIIARIRRLSYQPKKEIINKSLLFFSLGLTGVIPIMISMKQSGFYIIPAFPFFAIAFGILVYPFIESLMHLLNYKSKGFQLFKWMGSGLFVLGIFLSIYSSDMYSRDKNKIKDVYSLITQIPEDETININPGMYDDWGLHAYFGRFKNISLDPHPGNKREFLLIRNEEYSDTLKSVFRIVDLNTINYKLLKRK
jgi:4-amino-4-deoxy-L-arabinose transferase-like glycosyltransferase